MYFSSTFPVRVGLSQHLNTSLVSARVGGSTPPDDSRRTYHRSRVLRGVEFPDLLSQRWFKIFNPLLEFLWLY